MKYKPLNASEKYDLEIQHRRVRDSRKSDRIKAVLLYDEGWLIEAIAKVLRKNSRTIDRHLNEYHNFNKLHCDNKGSESVLDEEKTLDLIEHITDNPPSQVSEIVNYVKTTWNITLTLSGMTKWLHRQGISYKKPKNLPYKADEAVQADFIQSYETLKASAGEDQPILFMDAVHPTQNTKIAYRWLRKGCDQWVKTTGSRTRINLIGCIQLGHLSDTLTHQYKTINAESIVDFLQRIHNAYKEKSLIHLILDCAGYHKTSAVKEKAKELKIVLHFLPPYSPNLNPIERLWKVMNEKARNNVFFKNPKEFKDGISQFFNVTLPEIGTTLNSRINDKFQMIF